MPSKVKCAYCGRRMKQQHIGTYHCKCGMSRVNGKYIKRTGDMAFCLHRVRGRKKTKQVPVIRIRPSTSE